MNTEQAIRQAQQVWIGIRLLVVLAARALQPAVFDAAVVAHLREPQIGQILADALIDLLVVVDAIGARRDGECEADAESSQQSPAADGLARQKPCLTSRAIMTHSGDQPERARTLRATRTARASTARAAWPVGVPSSQQPGRDASQRGAATASRRARDRRRSTTAAIMPDCDTRNGPDGQRVGAGAQKHVDGFARRAHQRLAVDVEARIEHGAHAPSPPRLAQQFGERRCVVVRHDLRTARAIDAHHASQLARCSSAHLVRHRHGPIPAARPVGKHGARLALEHARTERLVPDAPLEHEIQPVAQVEPIGPREHAAVSKRARAVLHRALKPHHDPPVGEQFGDPARRFGDGSAADRRRAAPPPCSRRS